MNKSVEYRSGPASNIEVRAADDGSGVFEGYACLFNQVDDYNSMFERGAFTKTLAERGSKVKILYNHKDPVGKPIELREDDKGLYVRGQLSLGVEKADEAYKLMQDGVIDTLSFGFNTVADKYVGGVRHIREVKLFEVSPVTFASNENAIISDVRSMNFSETLTDSTLMVQGNLLFNSLQRTIDDIWWDSEDGNKMMGAVNKALDQFKAQFMKYSQAYVDRFRSEDSKRSLFGGEAAIELRKLLAEQECTVEEFALRSPFSLQELEDMLMNKLNMPQEKLAKLPESIRAAYQRDRNVQMEQFCTELRSNNSITDADKIRLAALLDVSSQPDEVQSAISKLQKFRSHLAG